MRILCALFLSVMVMAAPPRSSGSSSSRSYSSSPSRSYSAPSRPSPSPSSKSYSTTPAPAARPATPSSRTYSTAPAQSRIVQGSSSRTYSTYSGRTYVTHYYQPPIFVNRSYYYGYGDGGMPWWAWGMLWHNSQVPVAAAVPSGGTEFYEPGQTSFNWLGLIIWMGVLSLAGWAIWRFTRPKQIHYHRL